ncbi:MAG: tyrosine-type recombinase/integrase [Deltaproteobacteria bacterium]|nr:tyrosine-type recombinase/integrase [Deltaproteobacteria bacterium]
MDKKEKFTDERLGKIKPAPAGKREYYYDLATPGLMLAVTAKGTKTFMFQTWSKLKCRSVTTTIGRYRTGNSGVGVSLDDARIEAAILKVSANAGNDPQAEKREKRGTLTVAAILDLYITEHAIPHKRSAKDDQGKIRLHLKPTFGTRRVDELTPEAVRSWHTGLTKTMTPAAANRHLALLRSVYNTMLPDLPNPCRATKMFTEYSRDRFLLPEEIERFFQAVEEERQVGNPDMADYMLLSVFIGARRANVLAMQWRDIDFNREQLRIAGQDAKAKIILLVPLVGEVLEILTRRRLTASSVFVFPGTGKTGHLVEPKGAWARLKKRANLEDVRLHDLRRTMGSYQTIGGASTAIVGKTLGHKNQASTAVYARMTLDPVREAMEKAVALMKTPVEKKVVNITGGK